MTEYEKLILQNVKVLFAPDSTNQNWEKHTDAQGLKRSASITFDATNEEVQKKLHDYIIKNQISEIDRKTKKKDPEYTFTNKLKLYTNKKDGTTTKQFSLNVTPFTQVVGDNGLTKADIGYGATIDLVVNTFDYDTAGSKGTSMSISAIRIKEGGKSSNNDISLLLENAAAGNQAAFEEGADGVRINKDGVPF